MVVSRLCRYSMSLVAAHCQTHLSCRVINTVDALVSSESMCQQPCNTATQVSSEMTMSGHQRQRPRKEVHDPHSKELTEELLVLLPSQQIQQKGDRDPHSKHRPSTTAHNRLQIARKALTHGFENLSSKTFCPSTLPRTESSLETKDSRHLGVLEACLVRSGGISVSFSSSLGFRINFLERYLVINY
ncbi:hypothetical protein H6P81_013705 [Aristolochia fimbriata]|uniref:Uncharacterized protein n=1 Tax=Aristolochia fimbriata TaxID=158543 RepID=A0AAV7EFG4_ARIFI|nr:hypothetical protein H6P81_013705 [Aristolochia fimbriata]